MLLLLVVLVPSACLLWFMNQAMKNERLAVRQKLEDAYRGHLALAQQSLASHWRETGSDLDKLAEELPPSALFAREVNAGLADSVICLDRTGSVLYPNAALPQKREPLDPAWLEASRLESTDPALGATAFATLAERATNAVCCSENRKHVSNGWCERSAAEIHERNSECAIQHGVVIDH